MTVPLFLALGVGGGLACSLGLWLLARVQARTASRAGAPPDPVARFADQHPLVWFGLPALAMTLALWGLDTGMLRERRRNQEAFDQVGLGDSADRVRSLLGKPQAHLSLERLERESGFRWVYVRGQAGDVAEWDVWYGTLDMATARVVGLDPNHRVVLLAYGGT